MEMDFIDAYVPSSRSGHARPNRVVSGYRTLRFRNRNFPSRLDGNFEDTAQTIVDELEQDEDILGEGPVAEQIRKDAVKELPYTLTMKRRVKDQLTRSMNRNRGRNKPLGFWTTLKYKIKHSFNQFKASVLNLNVFQLWQSSLKEIEGRFGSSYASYFRFVRWTFLTTVFLAVLPLLVLVIPQILHDALENVNNTAGFRAEDIFIGDGFFRDTVLFYGHYTNRSFDLIPDVYFNMPTAYFATFAILYLVFVLILGVSVAISYNRSYIETEGGLKNAYASKIFCGWDFAIATREAATLKSYAIYNELKELLNDSFKENEKTGIFRTLGMFLYHLLVHVLVLGFLGLLGWSLWLLLDSQIDKERGGIVIAAVTANVIMSVVPTVLGVITRWEGYKNPKTALNVNLARTFLLGFVVVGVILAFWLTNHSLDCWETQLGQEIYRLVLFDFIISIVLMTVLEVAVYFGRRLFSQTKPMKSEFNVARHTLQIIYNQTLFLVGLFYSPLLPLVVALKIFLMWYIHKATLTYLCAPPTTLWRDAQTQTWFKVMTFVSTLVVIMVQGYTVKNVESSACGPFAAFNYTYEIILTAVDDIEETSVFWKILAYLVKPGVVAFIMIALSVLVYYFKEQSLAQKERVENLRTLLQWTAKDKEYLNNYYNEIMRELDEARYENLGSRYDNGGPTRRMGDHRESLGTNGDLNRDLNRELNRDLNRLFGNEEQQSNSPRVADDVEMRFNFYN